MANYGGVRFQNDRDSSVGMEGAGAEANVPPERQLACNVLWQALADATGGKSASRTTQESEQARHFLTCQSGEWRQARRDWCDAAGIDPDSFEERVRAVLARSDAAAPPMVSYPDGHARVQAARYRLTTTELTKGLTPRALALLGDG